MANLTIGKVLDYKNFLKAVKQATRGRFGIKIGACNFVNNLMLNYIMLKYLISNSLYQVGHYSKFTVNDTKKRVIHAPSFRDKIVQYLVNNVLCKYIEPKYITDSYACIHKRGHQAAVIRYSEFIRRSRVEYKNPMVVKIDLSKFFYSINRSVVFNILCKHVKDERFRVLLSCMLRFSEDVKGLPLGNLTSQQFANILLNEFDWYVKRTLGIKYYIRYADDMYMIVDGKKKAQEVLEASRKYLTENLDLVCNPKKCYISNTKCVSILGFLCDKNSTIRMLTRNKNKLLKIKVQRYVNDRSHRSIIRRDIFRYKKTTIRPATKNDIVHRLNSWYAHNKIARCEGWIEYVFDKRLPQDFIFDQYLRRFIIFGV